jgi:hypothetical protein
MDSLNFFLAHNNADSTLRVSYNFDVLNSSGSNEFAGTVSSGDIDAAVVCGNQFNTCNLNPNGNFEFDTEGFIFPTDIGSELTDDSAYFLVQKSLVIEDNYDVNNKSVFVQEFYNYYAYDDGTAELAYGLGNLDAAGFVAVKYEIKMEDSLQAIQIYLNPVDEDISAEPVKLMVWGGTDEPDEVLYESPEFINLEYSNGINYFYNYELDDALWVGETILWIGWRQDQATGVKFSVGFDQRSDNSDKVYYNLGSTWNQSSIPGSIMIRPVFGQPFDWVSGVYVNEIETLTVYPNPTTGKLFIQEKFSSQFKNVEVSILDLAGREVFSQTGYSNSLDVSRLTAGTYVFQIENQSGQKLTERVVIQP